MMFVDREKELDFLNTLLERTHPGPAQLVLLYGRRRVGKSELLLQWARQSGCKTTYWEAVKESSTQQRVRLFGKLLNVPASSAPVYHSWTDFWDAAEPLLMGNEDADVRRILILDELPYAAEADPAMLSSLQYAWDQYLQHSKTVVILCGSHVRVMETLLSRQSPLFGRMTAQWHLEPLPFSSLAEFFPDWAADERVAALAIAGGIPAYLKWLDPGLDLIKNIRQVILNPGGMFLAEPAFLLYDEVREPGSYLAILKALGAGAHTLTEISDRSFIPRTSVSFYLSTLQDLHIVERRLPATLTKGRRGRSRSGRYHLADPYFNFYFRFLEPFLSTSPVDMEQILNAIRKNLRDFVAGTFEELARQWVWDQGRAGNLPLVPDTVGSHWSRQVQVDVVAINWQMRQILLGECKWGTGKVGLSVMRGLMDRKMLLVRRDLPNQGDGWKIYFALFARKGFTSATIEEALKRQCLLVDLMMIDQVLGHSES